MKKNKRTVRGYKRKYICGGYWTESTTNGPSEFDCHYWPDFTCDECVINGGKHTKGIDYKMELPKKKEGKK